MKEAHEKIVMQLVTEKLSAEQKASLLQTIKEDAEAMAWYKELSSIDDLMKAMPLAAPSANFTKKVMATYDRRQVYRRNNRLMTYFIGVAAAIIILMMVLLPEGSAGNQSALWAEEISSSLSKFASLVSQESFIQLVLVANLIALVLVIEKIMRGRRHFNFHTFFLG